MSFLRRLRLFNLAWHAARWTPPTGVEFRILLDPERGRACVWLFTCCHRLPVPLETVPRRWLHRTLDNIASGLLAGTADTHAQMGTGGKHVLNIADMGTDQ